MPDAIELLPAKDNANAAVLLHGEQDQPKTLLSREAYLIGGGIKDGFMDRFNQAKENPGLTALEFTGAAVVGAGLTAMSLAGGRLGTAARIGTGTLQVLAIGDGIRRLAPTAYAMADTAINPQNYLENRATVARNLGTACFDYPLMAAGGMVGSSAVGFAPKVVSSLAERFNTKPAAVDYIKSVNPNVIRNSFDFKNDFKFDPKVTTENGTLSPQNTAKLALDAGKTATPKALAHENPPGAWQQKVPEGSNVNWLNHASKENMGMIERPKIAENIWHHEPINMAMGERALPKALADILAKYEPPKMGQIYMDISVQSTYRPMVFPALWNSWKDDRIELHKQ